MPQAIPTHKPRPLRLRAHQPVPSECLSKNDRLLKLDGAVWRRLRAMVLCEQPMCADCEAAGRITPATEVDHVDNDRNNNLRENLVGLCKPCHSRKTMKNREQVSTPRPCAKPRAHGRS